LAFGWNRPNPLRGAYSAPQDRLAGFKEEGKRKGGEREEKWRQERRERGGENV